MTVSPRNTISLRTSSTRRSCIMNHLSPSPPPCPALTWIFHVICASSSGFFLDTPGPVPDEEVEAILESRVTLDSKSYIVWIESVGFGSTSAFVSSIKGRAVSHSQSASSTPRRGKFTMVGFFSSTKLFLVNRLMWRMRYGGSAVR